MTDEIIKLYENAGVELVADVKFPTKDVNYNVSYPPFTADKQLELIKWLINREKGKALRVYNDDPLYQIVYNNHCYNLHKEIGFDNILAYFFNQEWYDFLEEEKEQIRGILE